MKDKVAIVEALVYASSDWHDWEEWYEYLREGRSYLVSPERAFDIMMNDVAARTKDFTEFDVSAARSAIVKGKEYEVCSEDGTILVIKKVDEDNYKLIFSNQFSTSIYYKFKTMPKHEVRYLAAREFVTAPRYTPLRLRTDFKYTKYLVQAKRDLASMEPKSYNQLGPFHEERKVILIGHVSEFEGNEWYEKEKEINALRDKYHDEYEASYSPDTNTHMKNMAKAIQGST